MRYNDATSGRGNRSSEVLSALSMPRVAWDAVAEQAKRSDLHAKEALSNV